MITRHRQLQLRLRRGLSLIEVIISTMLVGVVLVGAMDCLGAVIRGHMNTSNAGRGPLLAGQLMTEILSQSYEEPVDTPTLWSRIVRKWR